MRILVCGGRDYNDKNTLFDRLFAYTQDYFSVTIIHGGAKGADSLAGQWARFAVHASEEVYEAEWEKYGKKAGYLRNKRMLDEGQPQLVIAFPGGKGTEMMTRLALQSGIDVIMVGK